MINKTEILNHICYTELVYGRINNKLKTNLSKKQIEEYLFKILNETEVNSFSKVGKNFYVVNKKYEIRVTINSNTFRIITVDKI